MSDHPSYTFQIPKSARLRGWGFGPYRFASGCVGFASAADAMHSDREPPDGEKDALIRGSEGISTTHREQCRA